MEWSLSSSSTSPVDVQSDVFPIPENYKFLRILGKGSYGTVIECVEEETEYHVAVKVNTLNKYQSLLKEELIMNKLMCHGLDNFNIIKCIGKFIVDSKLSLVYEMLDISLMEYILDSELPIFKMETVRSVIQQMAVALDALKSVGVIHGDVKLDNIMMVDHARKPFRVKLIDFGLSMFTNQAKPGCRCQAPAFRAPEIILGLPFSEAIDIWSLGCVMAIMVFGVSLFPSRVEHVLLQYMIELLGLPPQHLINAASKSEMFFRKTEAGSWEFMTPIEYRKTGQHKDERCYTFTSLDVSNMRVSLEKDKKTEADERRECLELLKAMLQWDDKERITPSGILNHPFITKSFIKSSYHLRTCHDEPEPSTSQVRTKCRERTSVQQNGNIEVLPASYILVQPADPKNRIHLGNSSDEDRQLCLQRAARHILNSGSTNIREDAKLLVIASDGCKNQKDGENSTDRIYIESSTDSKNKKCPFSWMKRKFCSCISTDCVME